MAAVLPTSPAWKDRYLKGSSDLTFDGQPLRTYLLSNKLGWVVRLDALLDQLDWKRLRPSTWPVGRQPFPPDLIVRLYLYATLTKADLSLRSLERLARGDIGALYICHGLKPSYRTIGLILNRFSRLLADEFFLSVTRTLIEKLELKPGLTALDGTVVESAASRHRLVSSRPAAQLASELRRRLEQEPEDPHLPYQRRRAEQTQWMIAEREKKEGARQR